MAEYFLYDPRGEYLKPGLQGFELVRGSYRAMKSDVLPNGELGFASRTLGLALWDDASGLRFFDAQTAGVLTTPKEAEVGRGEAEKRAAAAEARATCETARRRELEARLAELESRWEALGKAEAPAGKKAPAEPGP